MRVVLDTNVIIAAFAARGLCSDIFELCLENHSIVTSEHILLEVEKNLIKKVRLPESIARNIIEYLRGVAEICEPSQVNKNVCRDDDDIKIIGTALSGDAVFIITGDEDLLVLKKYGKIKIVTPREFWNYLRGK
jgi:putative PIN family toxin of toxin-antitoxin system